jgi:hypothetical protein
MLLVWAFSSTVSNARMPIFTKDEDFVALETVLEEAVARTGTRLLSYCVMSKFFHLVLRSRPDVVREWSDEDVARRWLMLCPERRDQKHRPLEPTELEINSIVNKNDKLATVRTRLSDISWWMRLLSQSIAQRAQKEDGEGGKFFSARYRTVRLLDETAILACATYVDLDPIRAAMAETIEESEFTSALKRAAGIRRECSVGSVQLAVFSVQKTPIEIRRAMTFEVRCAAAIANDFGGGECPVGGATGVRYGKWRSASGTCGTERATGSPGGDLVSPGERLRQTPQCRRRSASANRQSFIEGSQVRSSLQDSSSGSGIDGEWLSSRLLKEESCSRLHAVQSIR